MIIHDEMRLEELIQIILEALEQKNTAKELSRITVSALTVCCT